jgi:hypothetical protein
MEHLKKLSRIWVLLLLMLWTVVFTYLVLFSLSFITNASGAISPVLVGICTVLLAIFTPAIVIFLLALYLLVIVGGLVELVDRIHYHKIVQKHRELDLQKHRRIVLLADHRRLMSDPYLAHSRQRATEPRLRRIEHRDWTRPY